MPAEGHEMVAPFPERQRQGQQRLRLLKGFSAAEGHAMHERILEYLVQDFPAGDLAASFKIPGLRVLASGTVYGAALHKEHKAQTRAVNDGFLDYAGYAKRGPVKSCAALHG
jgi:hypothetical protein